MQAPRDHHNVAPGFFAVIYWIVLSAVLVVFVVFVVFVVLFVTAFFSPANFTFWLQYIGLLTLVTMLILLIGDLVGYLPLRPAVRNTIFTTFVVAVLGASGAFIKRILNTEKIHPEIRPVILDETKLEEKNGTTCPTALNSRSNRVFKLTENKDIRIFVSTIVTAFGRDLNQRPHLTGNYIFMTRGGLSDIGEMTETTAIDAWKSRPMSVCFGPDKVAASLKVAAEDILFLNRLTINRIVAEEATQAQEARLKVQVHDRINDVTTEKEFVLQISK
jgi:hypothetical protein